MTRKEIIAYFNEHPELKEVVKSEAGVNWTNVANDILEQYIENNETPDPQIYADPQLYSCVPFERLLEVLKAKKIILQKEVDYILTY